MSTVQIHSLTDAPAKWLQKVYEGDCVLDFNGRSVVTEDFTNGGVDKAAYQFYLIRLTGILTVPQGNRQVKLGITAATNNGSQAMYDFAINPPSSSVDFAQFFVPASSTTWSTSRCVGDGWGQASSTDNPFRLLAYSVDSDGYSVSSVFHGTLRVEVYAAQLWGR